MEYRPKVTSFTALARSTVTTAVVRVVVVTAVSAPCHVVDDEINDFAVVVAVDIGATTLYVVVAVEVDTGIVVGVIEVVVEFMLR